MKIEIINWHKYNPRSDVKSSSWFRLQNSFCTDPDFAEFSVAQKMVWIYLLCEASKKQQGLVSVSERLIASILDIEKRQILPTLQAFESKGFIELRYDDVTQASRERARNIASTIPTDGRTDGTDERTNAANAASPNFTPQNLLELWNSLCTHLPKAKTLSDTRKKGGRLRLNEQPMAEYWSETFTRLNASNFATGINDRNWKADFDWILANDQNHVKVNEGKYDNKDSKELDERRKQINLEQHKKVSESLDDEDSIFK